MNLTDEILRYMDIDSGQWRALVRLSFKLIGRNQSAIVYKSKSKDSAATKSLWLGLIIYCFMGMVLAAAVAKARTADIASFFVLNITLPMIAMSMLLEFVTLIIFPEDLPILGYRPISSRTYFAAKISSVLIGILSYSIALCGPSVISFLFKFGLFSAIAWVISFIAGSLAVAMLMTFIYTMLVRHVRPERVRNIMGYVQLLFSSIIFGVYILMPKFADKYIAAASPGKWTIILPTRWYASIVAITTGDINPVSLTGVSFAIIFTMILVLIIADKVSLTYSEAVSASSMQSVSPVVTAKATQCGFNLFRRSEDRAVAMLIARQFRYDVKFKMAILGILPLTVFYVLMGLQDGKPFVDPFSIGFKISIVGPSFFVYFAMILFPATVRESIIHNDMYEASWIFFAAPIDRGNMMLSVYRIIIRTFIFPFLAALAFLFLWFYKNPMHVFMHLLVIFLFCEIFLSSLFLIQQALPFSMPRETGNNVTGVLAAMLFGSFLFIGLLIIFMRFLYPKLMTYLIGVVSLLVVSIFLKIFRERRLKRRGEQLEFIG